MNMNATNLNEGGSDIPESIHIKSRKGKHHEKKLCHRRSKLATFFILKCLSLLCTQGASAFQFCIARKRLEMSRVYHLSHKRRSCDDMDQYFNRFSTALQATEQDGIEGDKLLNDQSQQIPLDVKRAAQNAPKTVNPESWGDMWERPGPSRAQRAKYREEAIDDNLKATDPKGSSWGGRDSTWEPEDTPRRSSNRQAPRWNDDDDDFQYNPRTVSPFIKSLRNFYNSLFWYGTPMDVEAEEEFAGLKFPDLMALYTDRLKEREARRGRRPRSNERSTRSPESTVPSQRRKTKGIRNPDFPDWQFGWETEESNRDSSPAQPKSNSRRNNFFVDDWPEQRPVSNSRSSEPIKESQSKDQTPLALKSKQKQLRTAMSGLETDLERVDERLRVLDVSLEMWYRRINSMRKRGVSPEDEEVQDARRRIKELKTLGVVLEREARDLERQIDNCNTNIRRIDEQLQGNSN